MRFYTKSLSKADARQLQEAHALFANVHQYKQGGARTSVGHQAMLASGMKNLKAVFQPVLSDKPVTADEIGDDLAVPAVGKGYKLSKKELERCAAAYGVAAHLADHPEMHIAGRAMCKQAAGHIKAVFQPTIDNASTDDLGAALVGKMSSGRRVSPGVLMTLREVVDDRMEHIGDAVIEDALESGELLP